MPFQNNEFFSSSLNSGAGDVFVLDLCWFLDGVSSYIVGVPGYAFAGDFGVFGEEFKRIGRGGGIVFLVGEFGGLDGGFLLVAEAAVEDGELVMGGQVVGINYLQAFVGRSE